MYQSITLNSLKDNQKFKESFLWNNFFYKGIISDKPIDDYLFFENSDYNRESKTLKEHGNLYNLLINYLPAWQEFPLRKESIVFTNDFNTAKGYSVISPSKGMNYAKVFCVIPEKNSQVVMSPASDLWDSFKPFFLNVGIRNQAYSLTDFNGSFRKIANHYGVLDFDSSLEAFNALIQEIIDRREKLSLDESTNFLYHKIIEEGRNFIPKLDEIYAPVSNNFVLLNAEVDMEIEHNREFWTNGNCLLIEYGQLDKVLEFLKIII